MNPLIELLKIRALVIIAETLLYNERAWLSAEKEVQLKRELNMLRDELAVEQSHHAGQPL